MALASDESSVGHEAFTRARIPSLEKSRAAFRGRFGSSSTSLGFHQTRPRRVVRRLIQERRRARNAAFQDRLEEAGILKARVGGVSDEPERRLPQLNCMTRLV
jgi:hypothetical protein